MFAIAFDRHTVATRQNHPKVVPFAYSDIRQVLANIDFDWVQGSLYVSQKEDLSNLFSAIQALKRQIWCPVSVRDIREFRVEQWSDSTATVKAP